MEKKSKIRVMNKPRFFQLMEQENISDLNVETKFKDYVIISINDTYGKWSKSWFKKNHNNVIRLWFDDVEHDGDMVGTKIKRPGFSIKNKQIEELLKFIKINKHRKNIIIHCTAGISRSGAIGLYITQLLNMSIKDYLYSNPRVKPSKSLFIKIKKYYKNDNVLNRVNPSFLKNIKKKFTVLF